MMNVAMRIGGRDAASGDGRYYEKRNPFTGELIARVPDAGPLDAVAAVGAVACAVVVSVARRSLSDDAGTEPASAGRLTPPARPE